MYIICLQAVTCHIRPSPYERVDGKGTNMQGHHTQSICSSHKNKFKKYRYNILHSVLPNRLRRNNRLLTFSNYPGNTMIKSEQHRNTMSTSGTLITQEYYFNLNQRATTPFLAFKRFLQYPQFSYCQAQTLVGESPVTYDARAIRPDLEGQVLNRKRLRSKGSYIQSIPRKARTPVVFSCWRTSLIAFSVVLSRSTLFFNPWLFKSFRILFH